MINKYKINNNKKNNKIKNIYETCESNTEIISSISLRELYQTLEKKEKEIHNIDKKVVFVDISCGIVYQVRVVIYSNTIPAIMQEYKNKFFKLNGNWVRGSLLGYCDCCGEYTELTGLCNKGHVCKNCFEDTYF